MGEGVAVGRRRDDAHQLILEGIARAQGERRSRLGAAELLAAGTVCPLPALAWGRSSRKEERARRESPTRLAALGTPPPQSGRGKGNLTPPALGQPVNRTRRAAVAC